MLLQKRKNPEHLFRVFLSITSLGNHIGSSCAEKRPNQFSVNGEDSGVIEGTGSKHVSVTIPKWLVELV
jgi:hypothetical protein